MEYKLFRPEQTQQIIELFTRTFSDSEGEAEGKAIGRLVADLLATTSREDRYVVVAEKENAIFASILLTRLSYDSPEQAFLVAPVAVATEVQGKGVGQAILNYGLQLLRQEGVSLAFTYGDPNYYAKVGFEPVLESDYAAPLPLSYPHGWLAQSLTEQPLSAIQGSSQCVAAFNKPEFW